MGFTIETYQLYGLPPLNIYATIKGSYKVQKGPFTSSDGQLFSNYYNISFTVYFQMSKNDPVITQREMNFSIQALPDPAVLYKIIYDYIQGQLDPEDKFMFIDEP